MIKAIGDMRPVLGEAARVAESADLVGDVTLGNHASVWFGAVLRADEGPIQIGADSNIQDNSVVHVSPGHPVIVGERVTVGHRAILHGCTVENGALIGMGAILLNGCVIGAGAMVAAGALVTQGTVIPPRMLAMGSPAKVVRPVRGEELEANRRSALDYVMHAAEQLPSGGEAL